MLIHDYVEYWGHRAPQRDVESADGQAGPGPYRGGSTSKPTGSPTRSAAPRGVGDGEPAWAVLAKELAWNGPIIYARAAFQKPARGASTAQLPAPPSGVDSPGSLTPAPPCSWLQQLYGPERGLTGSAPKFAPGPTPMVLLDGNPGRGGPALPRAARRRGPPGRIGRFQISTRARACA